jgi:OOP family OmpA-OmpF porin
MGSLGSVARFARDTSTSGNIGSAVYNQALSERRAEVVKDEMVRLNVPDGGISAGGRGFDELLVQTGPGVREPQNRRAIIELDE